MCHYTHHRVDGVKLDEWLEDDRQWSRYAVEADEQVDDVCVGDSVWMCNECEHLEENCTCVDEDDYPIERY